MYKDDNIERVIEKITYSLHGYVSSCMEDGVITSSDLERIGVFALKLITENKSILVDGMGGESNG